MKILAIRLSALGDVLQTLPIVEAIKKRNPDSHLGWIVEERCQEVVQDHPLIDEVFVVRRKRWQKGMTDPYRVFSTLGEASRFFSSIRRKQFDVALDFQGNIKSAFWGSMAAPTWKIGYEKRFSKEGNHLFMDVQVSPEQENLHRLEKYRFLAESFTGPLELDLPQLPIRSSHEDNANSYLQRKGLGEEQFAVLHPGSSDFGSYKRWPPESFRDLANALEEHYQMPSIVTWGGGEWTLANWIARESAAFMGPRTESFMDLAALVDRASVFVGADSAPTHLSSMLGTPTIALFGPKNPAVYGPKFGRVEVIWKNIWCSPCKLRECPRVDCMKDIRVNEVLHSIRDLIGLE